MTPRNTLRLAFAGAAGLIVALVGAVAMSTPAGATGPLQNGGGDHAPSISLDGHATCLGAEGKWSIEWKISNHGDKDATVVDVTTVPSGEINLNGTVLPKGKSVVVTEKVAASQHSAALTVKAAWDKDLASNRNDHDTVTATGKVYFKDSCGTSTQCVSKANAHFTHTFDGPKGTATITLAGDKPLCSGQSQDFLLVSYFAPSPRAEFPQYKFDTDVKTIDADHTSVDLAVDVPACFTQVDLVFDKDLINPMTVNGARYNNRKLGSPGAPGSRSSGPPAWYNGGKGTCAMPAATMASSCDGSVTVHLSNGKDAHYAVPFTVTAGMSDKKFVKQVSVAPDTSVEVVVPREFAGKITVTTDGDFLAEGMWEPGHCDLPTVQAKSTCDSLVISVTNPEGNLPAKVVLTYGEQTKTITVEAGKTEEVTFTATDVTEATVDFVDFEKTVTVMYNRSKDCASPSAEPSSPPPGQPGTPTPGQPTPSSSTAPGLPVTGVQVGVFAGIGALLLGAGAILLFGARRRRLTETQ
jgi:hypothetical protein